MTQDISSEELYRSIENEKIFLLDIRNKNDFDRCHIEGKTSFPILNIPYLDLIEKGGKEDPNESITHFIRTYLTEKLPKNEKIVVTCSKGRSSVIVTDILTKLGYQAFNLSGGMKSWGNFYARKKILETSDFSIFQIIHVSKGCLSYVVISDGKAIVIDPLRNIQPYISLFNEINVKPQSILDTHAHADHISGGKELADRFGISYYLHPYDGIHPIDMLPAKFSYEASWADKKYPLGKIELKALHIPGHTLGNQAFLINDRYLFSGDSIFIQSVARPDLGEQKQTWTILHYESLRKLMELPDDIVVLPSHFSSMQESNADHTFSRRLGELKKENEGLIMAQRPLKEFSEYILSHLPPVPKEYMDIKRVNLGLLSVDDDKASELEIGKNICAVSHHHS